MQILPMGSVQSAHEPEKSDFSLETELQFHGLKPRCDFHVGDGGRKSLADSLKKKEAHSISRKGRAAICGGL